MQEDKQLAVLATEFKIHKENEEKWQQGIAEDLHHFKETTDLQFHELKKENQEQFQELKDLLNSVIPQIRENTQTLYGVGSDKNNGLRGDMAKVKEELDKIDAHWKTLVAVFIAIQLLWNVGVFIVRDIWPIHQKIQATEQTYQKLPNNQNEGSVK